MSRVLGRVFGKVQDAATRVIYGAEQTTSKMAFYSLVDRDGQGNPVEMSKFAGNVLFIVNVASK